MGKKKKEKQTVSSRKQTVTNSELQYLRQNAENSIIAVFASYMGTS